MALAFVNKSSTVNSSSGTSTAVALPASVVNGVRMVAVVGCIGTGNNVTPPAGGTWTKLAEFAPETNFKTAVFYRDATGAESGTATWTWSVGGRNFGHIVAYSGALLTEPPVATVAAGTPDSVGPHASASVQVADQGWLVTAVAARQSPGTAGAVAWSSSDGSDSERYDVTATNVGTGAQLATALYDSNRALAGSGSAGGVGGLPDGTRPINKYNTLWAGSGSMRVGATQKKEELDEWRGRLAGIDWMRIFPNSSTNLPPAWTDPRFVYCQELNADPFLSSKIDGNDAKIATLLAFLETMPSWLKDNPARSVWITDRHEPEGDLAGGAAAYIANITKFIQAINTLSAPIRAKVKVGPVLTRQYTENTAGRVYKTYDPGPIAGCDFFGVDMYANSWQALPDAATFLSKVKAYRYDGTDTRLRVFPELGAVGRPDDGTGQLRADWMQALQDQLVTWSQAVNGFPFGGWIWWNAEGKSGDSVAGLGTRRWFHLDRMHNGLPYTYYDSALEKNVTDPEGGFSLLPVVAGSGGGGAGGGTTSSTQTRLLTSAVQINSAHVWSVSLKSAAATPTVGGNPWSSCGCPAGIVAAVGGTLSAGADASLNTSQTFSRTATEPGSPTITARKWEIISGPLGTGMIVSTAAAVSWKPGASVAGSNDIRNPTFQEMAYQLTSTAENSTKDWTTAYDYIEDIDDDRGYTAGLIGFCSGTGDMLELVQQYVVEKPSSNVLAPYISGLQTCAAVGFGSGASAAAASNLGAPYIAAWISAATNDPIFRKVQRDFRKSLYWDDALVQALADGVGPLGLAIYYDVLVNHGVGTDSESFGGILAWVRARNTKPASGGNMTTWLNAVTDRRNTILLGWGDNQATDGRVWFHRLLINGGTLSGTTRSPNLNLVAPINWACYGDPFTISARPDPAADAVLGAYVLQYTATPAGSDNVTVTVS